MVNRNGLGYWTRYRACLNTDGSEAFRSSNLGSL
jgi:hypothetical protein